MNEDMSAKITISKPFILVVILAIIITVGFAMSSFSRYNVSPEQPDNPSSPDQPDTPPSGTTPSLEGSVTIGNERFTFNPSSVETVRSDLFIPGFFSMFDVLVHLDRTGQIDLEYHFDETMNTHIIDSLNGDTTWWYRTYYSGGWQEDNVFRPDHYPWKDGTTLIFYKLNSATHLENIYSVWREEIIRQNQNNGKLVIPKVIIRGRSFTKEFENVEVAPHNLRTDVFTENTTTAIDVILSLGDRQAISYELQWYESIGSAAIVKNYWVEGINGDTRIGRCGFVYEAGDFSYQFFRGNHIHLPADTRILNSPEYVEFFWICV